MKLSTLLPNVAKMELIHPEIGPTGIFINLIGQDSKVFRDKAKVIASSLVGKSSKDADYDKLITQSIELAAACIVGWSGLEDEEGNEIPYSPAKALELVADPGLAYLKEQVEEFIADRKNFFRTAGSIA